MPVLRNGHQAVNELGHLLTNPAHWIYEGITDVVYAIPVYFFGRWTVRRHDKKVHGKGGASMSG